MRGWLKSFFLTGSIAVLVALAALSLWRATTAAATTLQAAYALSALAALLYPLRLLGYYLMPTRTTAPRMPVLLTSLSLLALVTSGLSLPTRDVLPAAIAGFAAASGFAYVLWYSRIDRTGSALGVGKAMPAVSFVDVDGSTVTSAALSSSRTLYLFYRGNWCPLCMAQVREVAAQYQALHARGVQVVLVSPQPHENTQSLAQRFNVPMRFLTDPQAQAARTLGIVHEGGLPAGYQALGYDSDTVLPTVVLVERGGVVAWVDQTDNYRVRPEPEVFFAALDRLDGKPALQG